MFPFESNQQLSKYLDICCCTTPFSTLVCMFYKLKVYKMFFTHSSPTPFLNQKVFKGMKTVPVVICNKPIIVSFQVLFEKENVYIHVNVNSHHTDKDAHIPGRVYVIQKVIICYR